MENIAHHIQFLHQRRRSLTTVYGKNALEHAVVGLEFSN